jgi:hypothetical protein
MGNRILFWLAIMPFLIGVLIAVTGCECGDYQSGEQHVLETCRKTGYYYPSIGANTVRYRCYTEIWQEPGDKRGKDGFQNSNENMR